MQCHPHDSICGCSIDPVHEEMRSRFDQVEQMAEEIVSQSLEGLAAAIQTEPPAGGSKPSSALVVFNPTAGPRTDLVSAELETQAESSAFELVDENGAVVPFQFMGLGSRDLITMTMKRSEFRTAFLQTSGGEVMGLKLMGLSARQEGSQAFIEIVLSEKGEPDMALDFRIAPKDPGLSGRPGADGLSYSCAFGCFSASDVCRPGCARSTDTAPFLCAQKPGQK
jgi:mannosylglycerate hydrolase